VAKDQNASQGGNVKMTRGEGFGFTESKGGGDGLLKANGRETEAAYGLNRNHLIDPRGRGAQGEEQRPVTRRVAEGRGKGKAWTRPGLVGQFTGEGEGGQKAEKKERSISKKRSPTRNLKSGSPARHCG